jgi:hypothetical protein
MLADVVARGLVPASRVDCAVTNDRVEALRLGRPANRQTVTSRPAALSRSAMASPISAVEPIRDV